MKKLIGFLIIGAAVVAQAALLYAGTATYTLSAVIPTATGTSITAQQVTGGVWSSVSGSSLNFGTLTLTTFAGGDQAYLPASYFAIDVSGTGGSGTPNTTVTYTEGSKPASATSDQTLGKRSNVSFMALKYNSGANPTEYSISAHPKVKLSGLSKSVTAAQVTSAGTGASWLRIYVGLNDGTVSGLLPFSPADPSGTYTGTLTITATL